MQNYLIGSEKIRFGIFYISFSIIGLLVAFWYGFGWFIFFTVLRRVVIQIPEFYIPVIRFVVSKRFSQQEREKLERDLKTGINGLRKNILRIMIWIIFICIGFWKINIPIIDIITLTNK